MESTTFGEGLRRFLAAPVRARTYKRLVYLLLAAPLGVVYLVGFTAGSSTGLSLAVTLVGVPILLATLVATTAAAGLEAGLSRALLDRETPTPRLLSSPRTWAVDPRSDGYLAAIRHFVTEPTTWTSVGLVLLKFLFGLAAFVVVTVGGVTTTALLATPVLYDDPTFGYQFGSYVVRTMPAAVALSGLGLVGFVVFCNVCNALAAAGGALTDALLSVGGTGETA